MSKLYSRPSFVLPKKDLSQQSLRLNADDYNCDIFRLIDAFVPDFPNKPSFLAPVVFNILLLSKDLYSRKIYVMSALGGYHAPCSIYTYYFVSFIFPLALWLYFFYRLYILYVRFL